jgi:hypothetical protein
MPYQIEKESWQSQGTAMCSSRLDFEVAKNDKIKDPTLPFKRVEYHCRLGMRMADAEWDDKLKKWI